ncbi:MAG: hypothetical protein GY930_04865 [bacterium]|nr:hypothetical protein [bacterium]
MTEVVYIIAEACFAGDLSALSREAHVWVWLTAHNRALYDATVARDVREYSPHYGLSGYEEKGDALESLYHYLGTIDEHHGEHASDRPWEEIRIIGFTSADLDILRIQTELEVGKISVVERLGLAVIRRASQSGNASDRASPDR